MGTLTITGGTLRSRRVPTPPGRAVRPTPARVKEALFSILGSRVDDASVLDLFAGSGALGFESLSRGAAHVTFVEKHRPTADALRAAARDLGVADARRRDRRAGRTRRARRRRPLRPRLRRPAVRATTIPPPRSRRCANAARSTNATTVVYEHSSREPAPADPAMRVERTERYGEVALEFMRPLEEAA